VRGQTGAQPEGAFLNLVNWIGNVIAPVGAGLSVFAGLISFISGRGAMRYMLAALGGIIALSLQHADVGYAAILIALYVILLAGIGIVLGHVEAHAIDADSTTPPLVSEVAYQNRWYEVLLDLALISIAYYTAFRFRFQGEQFAQFFNYFAASFPLVLACQMAGLAIAGKYRQVWRSFGAPELLGIIKGVWIGVASSALVILYLPYRFEGFSRLVFAIDAVVLVFLLVVLALTWRILKNLGLISPPSAPPVRGEAAGREVL